MKGVFWIRRLDDGEMVGTDFPLELEGDAIGALAIGDKFRAKGISGTYQIVGLPESFDQESPTK